MSNHAVRRKRLRARLAEAQNHRCCYCGVRMADTTKQPDSVTLEHVQAKSHGGRTTFWNCAAACYLCNYTRDVINPTKFAKAKAEGRPPCG